MNAQKPDRHELQANGKHPAPCAKFCEATAFTIELRRAQAEIERLKEEITRLHEDAAAGASPVEPSQAQPPAPSVAAREYMTGYSDGREWAAAQLAAAQGQEPVDAVPLSDMVEGSHPSYGRGLFATDNCVKQFYAAPIPQQPAEQAPIEADMFWNHDDAEKLYFSIDEFLNDEICNGTPLEVGDTRTIQCALRLPNIEIRITAVHDEECEADYEVVAAAPQPKEPATCTPPKIIDPDAPHPCFN